VTPDLDVAVVGAGIAGLTAAEELGRAGLSVRVFEAEDHVGGRMSTFRHKGYTVDEGAEQISAHGYRASWELLERLGVTKADVPLIRKPIAVWRGGRAHPGVAGPRGLFSGAGLCPRARLDLARVLGSFARRRSEFDHDRPEDTPLGATTVAEFAAAFHPDLHDYLFQPVAGSFFGWDTARSAAAPLVSLLLAVGPASTWRTYPGGMDTLARLLAQRVDVTLGSPVRRVQAERDFARLSVGSAEVTARSVLLCVPAPVAASLYANPPEEEREFLRGCTFTPMLKVSSLLDRPLAPVAKQPLYTLLTPGAEDPVLSAIIVDHHKHPGRAPAGKGLLSLMPAAPTVPGLLEAADADVVAGLSARAERYVPGLRAATVANFVHRFRYGLPEATPAALALRPRFMTRRIGPVDYAGDWVLLRPSSEGAVRSAALAVSRVLSHRGAQVKEPV
jgi:oxygen-dependent protoporphyrinogen oxidase